MNTWGLHQCPLLHLHSTATKERRAIHRKTLKFKNRDQVLFQSLIFINTRSNVKQRGVRQLLLVFLGTPPAGLCKSQLRPSFLNSVQNKLVVCIVQQCREALGNLSPDWHQEISPTQLLPTHILLSQSSYVSSGPEPVAPCSAALCRMAA